MADTDFGTLLARRHSARSSALLFRLTKHRLEAVAALLLANLPFIEEALTQGSLVVFEATHVRVRPLPITDASGGAESSAAPSS